MDWKDEKIARANAIADITNFMEQHVRIDVIPEAPIVQPEGRRKWDSIMKAFKADCLDSLMLHMKTQRELPAVFEPDVKRAKIEAKEPRIAGYATHSSS